MKKRDLFLLLLGFLVGANMFMLPYTIEAQSDNINVLDAAAASKTIAFDNIGSVFYQRIKRVAGGDGSAADYMDKTIAGPTTFTTVTCGTVVDASSQGMSRFSLQVVETGTVTSWTVTVQGSLNNTNFDATAPILTHTKATNGSGGMIATGAAAYPVLYYKVCTTALTLGGGTNVIATAVGMP